MNRSGCFISICIPAYKRTGNLERLLLSIHRQTFKDYEIIIADDSPDNSVADLLQKYSYLPIVYYKNSPALGTPANWNFAISKASGEWIKLIHDDDWLAQDESLERFAAATKEGKKFIFSAYTNVPDDGSTEQPMHFPASWKDRIMENPVTLLPRNVIGPPSVTLLHSSISQRYDTYLKWRVDIDYYIRILKEEKAFTYIDDELIKVGINPMQVTNSCIDNPEVELPEGLILLQKYGVPPLQNIRVYDAWWRIIRNIGIRSVPQLQRFTPHNQWPVAIHNLVLFQSVIPAAILKMGIFSKFFMAISYLLNRPYLNKY